jgi:phosphatidylethanolamine/phosphatidyl-N-methylethanolamine N-methyltransferase
MSHDPDRHVIEKAYARWAPIYDALCGPVFVNGRRAAARAACDVGGCILEIGVGTGLSFDDYDAHTEITGIDISEPVMDAHALAYADASFDCVVGQFVITLVANPERVLSECARVVRPGGQIILVNHLYSERGLAAAVERLLAQKARPLGLRPEFPFQRLADWALTHGGAELIERRRLRPFGVYTLVRFRRAEAQCAAA